MTWAVVFVILVCVGAVPLLGAWRWAARQRTNGVAAGALRAGLAIVTVSFLWCVGGVLWQSLLGGDYSPRRYATISANICGVALVACCASSVALCAGRAAKARVSVWRFLVAALGVVLDWLYVAVVSSAV